MTTGLATEIIIVMEKWVHENLGPVIPGAHALGEVTWLIPGLLEAVEISSLELNSEIKKNVDLGNTE